MRVKDGHIPALAAIGSYIAVIAIAFANFLIPLAATDLAVPAIMGCTVVNCTCTAFCSCYVISRCTPPEADEKKKPEKDGADDSAK